MPPAGAPSSSAAERPASPSRSPSPPVVMAELRARREELGDKIAAAWEENSRLSDQLDAQTTANAGMHLALAVVRGRRAVGKLLSTCGHTIGLRLAASPLTAAPYRCVARLLEQLAPSPPPPDGAPAEVSSAAAHDAAQPKLTRRYATMARKGPTEAEKKFKKIYVP